ncbi:short-chain oxidoreductase [Cantharellus anzutake]|uniref:short-chain oxidoreductase n=1 Tax=Cantharellus anzutake TaxID=1750568 RepID=UPI0019073AEF|nr:short-chain oxidoreductase [Cantharellus anzutake]KAF8339652.1 short-chain oxidoreductase [Cantharellus anzutake]
MVQLVWLITGTTSGLGRDITLAALKRGDKVIATARRPSTIEDLKAAGASILELDVTSPLEKLKKVAEEAHSIYGRIDVVLNNAGYFEIGSLEENTPEETFKQFDTNVFGGLNVARAFLPYQRKAKSGTIVWIGSLGGWGGGSGYGLYSATKHAVRAISESLHEEISPLGLRSIYLEPGYFRTSFLKPGKRSEYVNRIEDYKSEITARIEVFVQYDGKQPGDPKKFSQLLIDFVKLEGPFSEEQRGGKKVPIGLPVGSDAYDFIKARVDEELKIIEDWKEVISNTDI